MLLSRVHPTSSPDLNARPRLNVASPLTRGMSLLLVPRMSDHAGARSNVLVAANLAEGGSGAWIRQTAAVPGVSSGPLTVDAWGHAQNLNTGTVFGTVLQNPTAWYDPSTRGGFHAVTYAVLFTRVANTTGFRTFFCANQNTTTQQFYAGLTSNSLYFAVGCGTARTVTGATVSIGQHYIAAYSSRAPDDHKIIVRSLSSTGYQSNSITLSCGTSGLAPVDVGLNMRQSSLFMAGVYKHADMLWDRGLDDTELAELMRDPRQVWTTRPERKLFVIPAAGTNATPGAGTGTGTAQALAGALSVSVGADVGTGAATELLGTTPAGVAPGAAEITGIVAALGVTLAADIGAATADGFASAESASIAAGAGAAASAGAVGLLGFQSPTSADVGAVTALGTATSAGAQIAALVGAVDAAGAAAEPSVILAANLGTAVGTAALGTVEGSPIPLIYGELAGSYSTAACAGLSFTASSNVTIGAASGTGAAAAESVALAPVLGGAALAAHAAALVVPNPLRRVIMLS